MYYKPLQSRKKCQLPSTTDLQNLIKNLKISKPDSSPIKPFPSQQNYQTILKPKQQTPEKICFNSVIQDQLSSYQCFQQLEKEYIHDFNDNLRNNIVNQQNRVVLKSPIYKLDHEEQPFQRKQMTEKRNRTPNHIYQATLSTQNKINNRVYTSKDCSLRKQLFKENKQNLQYLNNRLNGSNRLQPQKSSTKLNNKPYQPKLTHKFSNYQSFLKLDKRK